MMNTKKLIFRLFLATCLLLSGMQVQASVSISQNNQSASVEDEIKSHCKQMPEKQCSHCQQSQACQHNFCSMSVTSAILLQMSCFYTQTSLDNIQSLPNAIALLESISRIERPPIK
jgi:hypothetical protein